MQADVEKLSYNGEEAFGVRFSDMPSPNDLMPAGSTADDRLPQ